MLTLHAADLLSLTEDGGAPLPGGAVLVSGDRIAAVGPLDELVAAHPTARVRRWPGTLGPALVHESPLPDAPTPRERVHALLSLGAFAVPAARLTDPADRAAAVRAGVVLAGSRIRPPAVVTAGRADLAVFDDAGHCLATVVAGRLLFRRT